jgi:hypothetical protein
MSKTTQNDTQTSITDFKTDDETQDEFKTVEAGKQDTKYKVKTETVNGNYIVQYTDKDKSQVVDLGPETCSCTYRQYNETCPHIEAVQKVKSQEEDGQEEDETEPRGSTETVEDETGTHTVHQSNMYMDADGKAQWVDDHYMF